MEAVETQEMQKEATGTSEQNNNATPQQSADLNLSDLIAIKNILEVASQRGAFKASELEAVGKAYNKLNNFLESTGKKE